jgi:hypothetical protein
MSHMQVPLLHSPRPEQSLVQEEPKPAIWSKCRNILEIAAPTTTKTFPQEADGTPNFTLRHSIPFVNNVSIRVYWRLSMLQTLDTNNTMQHNNTINMSKFDIYRHFLFLLQNFSSVKLATNIASSSFFRKFKYRC